uniref:PHD-type domain-containing protein n=1 Tax=Xiphophorus couchianus TaxID=32473 RepID=A0A3B5L3S3_9TELE
MGPHDELLSKSSNNLMCQRMTRRNLPGREILRLRCGLWQREGWTERQTEALIMAAQEEAFGTRAAENSSEDDCTDKTLLRSEKVSPTKVPLYLSECWIHEDCGIWSAGVFLVRGKLYGLEEAAQIAQETICSTCHQPGAIMGCFQKGCLRNYHYPCAIQSGAVLNEENFSMRCPEHKAADGSAS